MDMTQYAGNESNYLKAADLQGKKGIVLTALSNSDDPDDDIPF